MRKIVLIAVIIIAALSVNQLNAQIKGGFKMGMDLSNIVTKSDDGSSFNDDFNTQRLISPRLGFIMEIPVYEGLYIEPGVFGAVRGFRYDSTRVKNEVEYDSREFEVVICVDIPVNIGYKYDFDPVSVFGKVGPVFSINTYMTNLYRIDGEWDNDHQSVGTGPNDNIKPFDFSVNFEAGVQLDRFQLSASYIHGLTNQLPQDDFNTGVTMKSNVFTISAAVLFGKFNNKRRY